MFKLKIGEGKEPVPGVEEGVVGMRKAGKRLLLVPPALGRRAEWTLLEVEIIKIKSKKDGVGTIEQAKREEEERRRREAEERMSGGLAFCGTCNGHSCAAAQEWMAWPSRCY